MRRIAVLLLALAAPLAAQTTAHPNFSGKWTLDAAASGAPAGVSAQVTIAQDEKTLKVDQTATTPMGPQAVALTYAFEGPSKNTVSTGMGSADMNSTVAWDGAVLVIKTRTDVQGQSIDQNDRWTLSADGKTLTISSDISVAGQSMQRKQVLTKS